MSRAMSFLHATAKECLVYACGVFIALAVSALVLWLCAPIDTTHYAFISFASSFVGALVWLVLLVLARRFTPARVGNVLSVLFTALSFQILIPLGLERSFTVVMLQDMARAPTRVYTVAETEKVFTDGYLKERGAIKKRLEEGVIAGSIDKLGDGYRISEKGHVVVTLFDLFGRIFSVPRVNKTDVPLPPSPQTR